MSSNTRTILQAGIDLLKLLDDWGVPAVIAGGFCRDYICQRPIRDIDLYVSCLNFDEVHKRLREAPELSVYNKDEMQFFSQHNSEYVHQFVQCQIEFDAGPEFVKQFPELAGFPINLIGLRYDTEVQAEVDGQSITEKFNLSMSQAWIDADTKLICSYSPKFVRDVRLAQNTVLREDWGHEATAQAIRKFQKKYPDFTIVNEDGTKWNEDVFMAGAYWGVEDGQPTEQQEWLDFDHDC